MGKGIRVKVMHDGFYGPILCNGIKHGNIIEILDYPEIVFMSAETAREHQASLMEPAWYYATELECCGVFPKFCDCGSTADGKTYLQCEVCTKRTEAFDMPW